MAGNNPKQPNQLIMSFEGQRGVEELATRLDQINFYQPTQQTSNNNSSKDEVVLNQQQQQQIYCHSATRRNPLAGSDLTNLQQNNLNNVDNDKNNNNNNNFNDGGRGGDDDDESMDISSDQEGAQENEYQRSDLLSRQQMMVSAANESSIACGGGTTSNNTAGGCGSNNNNTNNSNNILIVTNVDSSVFFDKDAQAKFESLFLAYDSQVTFTYLRSFSRVRLDFAGPNQAELARSNLSNGYQIGDTIFKCYLAQIIRPQSQQQEQTSESTDPSNYGNNLKNNSCYNHLNIPKLTKQFLISPPASPPVGWEPVTESSPCIDVQLISAIANLVPGKVHEIHAGNESQPGIYVEVCEDAQFPAAAGANQSGAAIRQSRTIPKTASPLRSM